MKEWISKWIEEHKESHLSLRKIPLKEEAGGFKERGTAENPQFALITVWGMLLLHAHSGYLPILVYTGFMATSGEAGGNSRGILESWPFCLLTVNRSPNLLICNKIRIAVLQSDWHIIFVFSKFLLKIFMPFWKVTFHLQLLQNRFFKKNIYLFGCVGS